jgi:WS/DGAT/MGAT family acyltransferase
MWLNMDRPNNLMVIDSVMWFDEPVDWPRLTAVVQRRLVDRYPVFHQRPVSPATPLGQPHWEDDPDFTLARHLHRATLPVPGGEQELRHYAESLMHQPFDRSHPLWELHLVDGYSTGAAIVSRFHHSLADGIALANVLLSLTDATATGDLEEAEAEAEAVRTGRGRLRGSVERAADAAASALTGSARLVTALPRLADPRQLPGAVTLARQTVHVADKLLLGRNPMTPISGTPGVLKRAVWSSPRPLPDIKRVARLAGATVNDVVVCAVSGALSAYLVDHGGRATDLTTMVPVNLRPLDRPLPRELGNQFALVLLPLPTGPWPPLHRLAEAKRRMDSIKVSPEAVITFGLINAIGRTGPRLERLLVDFFASKAFGITTNVAGPVSPRYVAGTRIVGTLGWVPGSGQQSLGTSIFTYDGTVRVGFKVDAGLVPDPEKLVHAYEEEVDDLLRIARAV